MEVDDVTLMQVLHRADADSFSADLPRSLSLEFLQLAIDCFHTFQAGTRKRLTWCFYSLLLTMLATPSNSSPLSAFVANFATMGT